MRLSQLWEVRKTHSRSAYNDDDEYAIFDGNGNQLTPNSLGYGVRRELLDVIVSKHNHCFLEDAEAKENKNG